MNKRSVKDSTCFIHIQHWHTKNSAFVLLGQFMIMRSRRQSSHTSQRFLKKAAAFAAWNPGWVRFIRTQNWMDITVECSMLAVYGRSINHPCPSGEPTLPRRHSQWRIFVCLTTEKPNMERRRPPREQLLLQIRNCISGNSASSAWNIICLKNLSAGILHAWNPDVGWWLYDEKNQISHHLMLFFDKPKVQVACAPESMWHVLSNFRYLSKSYGHNLGRSNHRCCSQRPRALSLRWYLVITLYFSWNEMIQFLSNNLTI